MKPLELPFQAHSTTSRRAAASMVTRAGGLRDLVLQCIRDAGQAGVTDDQISYLLDLPGNTARPRRIELLDAGLIEPAGQALTRRQHWAVTWRAKP